MSKGMILTRSLRSIFVRKCRRYATTPTDHFDPKDAKLVPEFEEEVQEVQPETLYKGGLQEAHRRILMGQKPYDEPMMRHHETTKYRRKLLGRYGMEASGVPPGIAWPSMQEIALIKEYEGLEYPKTLQEEWQEIEKRNRERKEAIVKREAVLEANMAKLEKWKAELAAKIRKKEEEIIQAQEKKEKMMREIRRHFGYNLSPKDERFQAMLQEKEEQEKLTRKAARRKLMEARKQENLKKMEETMLQLTAKSENELDEEVDKKMDGEDEAGKMADVDDKKKD